MSIFNDAPSGDVLLWEPHGAKVRWWGLHKYVDRQSSWNILSEFLELEISWRVFGQILQDFSWHKRSEINQDTSWRVQRYLAKFQNSPDGEVLLYQPIIPDVRWWGLYGYVDVYPLWHIRKQLDIDLGYHIWGQATHPIYWHIRDEINQDSSYVIDGGIIFDLGWHVRQEINQNTCWNIITQFDQQLAYHILTSSDIDISWRITNQLTHDFEYKIFSQYGIDTSWFIGYIDLDYSFAWNNEGSPVGSVFKIGCNTRVKNHKCTNFITGYVADKKYFSYYSDGIIFTHVGFPQYTDTDECLVLVVETQSDETQDLDNESDISRGAESDQDEESLSSHSAKTIEMFFRPRQIIFLHNCSKEMIHMFKASKLNFNYNSRRGIKYGSRTGS